MCTTSIVLCTCNGENYIIEQLDSLLAQTLKPDEVLIFDDRSDDNTVKLIQNFISKNSLSTWKIQINTQRLGWKKNFIEGILKSKGEIIFCCDQDDIWLPNKIYDMCFAMNHNKKTLVLGGCAQMVDQDGKILKYKFLGKMFQSTESAAVLFKPFNRYFAYSLQPGCALCFRKDIIPIIQKYWQEGIPHDQLIWAIGYLFDSAYLLDKNVIYWRRHSGSVYMGMSKIRSSYNRFKRLYANRDFGTLAYLIASENKVDKQEYKIQTINKYLYWNQLRYDLIKKKKIFNAFKLLGYLPLYNEKKIFLADLYDFVFYRYKGD